MNEEKQRLRSYLIAKNVSGRFHEGQCFNLYRIVDFGISTDELMKALDSAILNTHWNSKEGFNNFCALHAGNFWIKFNYLES